ncbi:MAG: Hsp20/alpha crystallin family protein [Actinomycetia bacterium]|nr:Hsp20/alpha crystallin family protein [Actinomycetes bacterium]MCP3909620.1 Hsp20/alpha crystallin family protein [Actinomycetes bacterium]MCP4086188.1 Hsp20/alpha crystallin family protein [Actinomycetes bacterium]
MLLRFDPFRDLDRVFEAPTRATAHPSVPFDAVRKDGKVVIHFDLPGVNPADVDLTVERNVLTLKAIRDWVTTEGEEVITTERRHGEFVRQLHLGENLDTGAIAATHEHGVLTVEIPVAETAKARKVEVAAPTPAIEAEVDAA